jgi:hypothetical protein
MAAADARPAWRRAGRGGLPGGWRLGTGAGILSAEGTAGYLHPAVGVALAVADIAVPAAVAAVLLAVILLGSDQRCERAFRLLRWIAGRAEPLAPRVPGLRQPRSQAAAGPDPERRLATAAADGLSTADGSARCRRRPARAGGGAQAAAARARAS